jgi:putative transcriptional regulator
VHRHRIDQRHLIAAPGQPHRVRARAPTDVEGPRRDLREVALEEFLGPRELDPRGAACEPLELHPSLVMAEDLGVHGVSSLGARGTVVPRDDGAVEPLSGHLLIAGTSLLDPNFRRAVVLIGHHDDEGAVGVVLNRASEVEVAVAVPPLAGLVEPGDRLFIGGPVSSQSAVVVADFEHPEAADVVAFDSVGFLPDEADAASIGGLRRARVFAGYAGWQAGQLEAELGEGSWITEPALASDVFTQDPDALWADVLRRKGPEYRLMSTMPFDPDLN